MTLTDHQRIHPTVNMEAPPPPTTALVRPGTSISSSSSLHQKPLNQTQPRHPPSTQPNTNIPMIITPPKRRSCFCKCLCYTICTLILLIIIIGATLGLLYLIFKPKIPNYSINNLRISDLRLNFDMTLYAKFDVKITAYNPNKKIGIYYEKGGVLSVWYSRNRLCEGSLPRFYQGHENRTVLNVELSGRTEYGNALMNALQEQQQNGRVPLDLKVDTPVSVKLGKLKLRKVRVLGECSLIVDSLSASNLVSIKASNCKFRLKL